MMDRTPNEVNGIYLEGVVYGPLEYVKTPGSFLPFLSYTYVFLSFLNKMHKLK